MDEETKAALDSLLSHPRPKTRTSSSAVYEKIISDSYMREAVLKVPKPAPNAHGMDSIPVRASVKDQVAILSINNSKACVVLRAEFSREVLNEFKAINKTAGHMKWNEKDEVLEIHPTLLTAVKQVLKTHYADVSVFGVQKQLKTTKFDALMHKLDANDKAQIYKLLARKYHPDLGGDKETMILINSVFKEN